jgi:hypothetical protein
LSNAQFVKRSLIISIQMVKLKNFAHIVVQKKKTIYLHLADKLETHDFLKSKTKRKGFKRPIIEILCGDELFKTENKWVYKIRKINREINWYFEIVIDDNGNIIIYKSHPLTEHKGHGSDKSNRKGK